MKLIPLHVYSEYSFLKSGLTLEKLASVYAKQNIPFLTSTDVNFLYAFPALKNLAKEVQLRPIYGMDFIFEDALLTFFVENEEGYLHLLHLSNAMQTEEINAEFLASHQEGLRVVLSSRSYESIDKIRSIFPSIVLGLEYLDSQVETIRKKALEHRIPLMAYPMIRYVKKEDAIVLDIARAISQNETLEYKIKEGEDYLHPEEDYLSFYTKEEIKQTEDFAQSFTFDFHKKRGKMLQFSSDSASLLEQKVQEGKQKRKWGGEQYDQRLRYELDVIHQMGYDDYFLIVADYVQYAKSHAIAVGPGRGSAAGSLVSYALGITEVDPLQYSLYFERFLNPKRQTMPDIDIDFEDIRREEMVDYLEQTYGKNRVARIITYQTIGAKQAIRDIGRVFSYSNFEIDYLSRILGNHPKSLRDAYKTNANFKELIDREPHYLEIVRLASKMEGLIRQSSIHAAGIVLNDVDLRQVLPVLEDRDGHLITQYEMGDLEEEGFLKMDLLSLRNLTLMKQILAKANSSMQIQDIPRDDEKAISLISKNMVTGIFQLESAGMRNAIAQLKPSCFEDIAALIALYRPGPMKEIPTYARRKAGLEKATYWNKEMERILAPTYGIILYQEQIMQIATSMAGLSLAKSDLFRRAISKKDAEQLTSLKEEFFQGCKKNGYSEKEITQVYEHISRFADYGFNRNHSVGYAVIVCQMAYLKAHHTLAFYATMLQNEKGTEKFQNYLTEIRSLSIPLSLPNIQYAEKEFSIHEQQLVFGLSFLKGFPSPFIPCILQEREKGPFTSFFHFVKRLFPYHLTEEMVEILIDGGALDEFGSRADLRASISNAFLQAKNDEIFQNGGGLHYPMRKAERHPFEDLKREYEVLGTLISGSPLDYQKEALQKYHPIPILEASKKEGRKIVTAGMIHRIQTMKTKAKQESMAYLTLFDETGEMEAVIFPRVYQEIAQHIRIYQVVVVTLSSRIYRDQRSYCVESLQVLEENI